MVIIRYHHHHHRPIFGSAVLGTSTTWQKGTSEALRVTCPEFCLLAALRLGAGFTADTLSCGCSHTDSRATLAPPTLHQP